MKSFAPIMSGGIAALTLLSVAAASAAPAHISQKSFGKTKNGSAVSLYTLTNSHGALVQITNYGGIITSIKVPDRHGRLGDVVLGFDTVGRYEKDSPYFGALIGRYGNRIARGRFTLDGETYKLFVNNGPNSLHGGKVGFDKRVWTAMPVKAANGVGLALNLLSKNGDEGYPGNLNIKVVYTWTNDNALKISYTATTDKDTVLNPTNHSYFNLAGAGNGTVLDTTMMINADQFTPVDKTQIPTGVLRPVAGTPFDFRRPHAIGARINLPNPQLLIGAGYDHNFVLNGSGLKLSARAYSPRSGRVLTEYTTEPGVQLYTGNFLDGKLRGKGGKLYARRGAFCLEAQHFPDSPNHPSFPTTELKPGETYRQTTVYAFSVR
jgi:aldose 1-epimerase